MVDKEAIRKQLEKAIQAALIQVTDIAQEAINDYLDELAVYMGVTSPKLGWAPLTPGDDKFWYKTGTVAEHIVSKITIEKNRVHVVAGLPSDAPGYQEALWNEFGWTPHGTSKVVRRALFTPLAEQHIKELNEKLYNKFSKMKLNIRINI
jgi:hypothetical protein